mgnify:CR=1 FL=1
MSAEFVKLDYYSYVDYHRVEWFSDEPPAWWFVDILCSWGAAAIAVEHLSTRPHWVGSQKELFVWLDNRISRNGPCTSRQYFWAVDKAVIGGRAVNANQERQARL